MSRLVHADAAFWSLTYATTPASLARVRVRPVECCLRSDSVADTEVVAQAVKRYLEERIGSVVEHSKVSVADDAFLSANVESLEIGGRGDDGTMRPAGPMASTHDRCSSASALSGQFLCRPRVR